MKYPLIEGKTRNVQKPEQYGGKSPKRPPPPAKPNINVGNCPRENNITPPDMPKEYYDSMVTEYLNEQEKLYDFFTPED